MGKGRGWGYWKEGGLLPTDCLNSAGNQSSITSPSPLPHAPSNHATPTVARQPDNAGATGCGVVWCTCERVCVCGRIHTFKIADGGDDDRGK